MTRRSEVGIDLVAHDMASREIERVGGSLNAMGGQAQTSGRHFGLLGTVVSGVANGVFLGVGMMAVGQLTNALSSIPGTVIGMNAELEKSTLQFQTLFGGGADAAARAEEHVRALFDFAKRTPFETGPIIQASRTLQTFGGDALNTMENLTMIGDAAAGASTDINEVSFWVGRAYAAIKGGQPFGEARMRLQELALLSPQAAQEMERLQKAGASTAEVWAVMEKELGRFNGAMDLQANTWSGLMSTLSDTFKLTMADSFKPFFDYAKQGVSGLITLFSSEGFQGAVQGFATVAVAAFDSVIGVVGNLWSVVQPGVALVGDLIAVFSAFGDGGRAASEALGALPGPIQDIVVLLRPFVDLASEAVSTFGNLIGRIGDIDDLADFSGLLKEAGAAFTEFRNGIYDAVFDIAESVLPMLTEAVENLADDIPAILSGLAEAVLGMLNNTAETFMEFGTRAADLLVEQGPQLLDAALELFQSLFDWIVNEGVPMAAEAIGPLALKFVDWVGETIPKLVEALLPMAEAIINFIAENLPVLVAKIAEWAGAFLGWIVDNVLPRLGPLLLTVGTAILTWIGETIPVIAARAVEMGKKFLAGVGEFLGRLPGLFGKFLAGAVSAIIEHGPGIVVEGGKMILGFIAKVVEFGMTLPAKFGQFIIGVVNALPGFVANLIVGAIRAGRDFVGGFIDGLSGLPRQLFNTIRNAFKNLRIDIGPFHISSSGVTIDLPKIDVPSFAVGSWQVPQDMFAVIHKDEMILPADIANRFRSAAGSNSAQTPVSRLPAAAGVPAAGGGVTIYQTFNFGRDAVRSDDDIRRMGVEMQERAQLLGFTGTVRQMGRATV